MATTRSTPCQKLSPPSPGCDHSAPRFAPSSAHQVRYASEASTTQSANRFTHSRTNPIGPTSARIVAAAAAASFQTQSGPCTSACAAVAMTITSKIVQPRFWTMFSAVGR